MRQHLNGCLEDGSALRCGHFLRQSVGSLDGTELCLIDKNTPVKNSPSFSIRAVSSNTCNSKLKQESQLKLATLATTSDVLILWVPCNSDIYGKEKARIH